MKQFILGATFMAYLVAGLFFLRFWKETRDRFFISFAMAFAIMGFNQVAFIYVDPDSEARTYFYIARFFAFMLIFISIVNKNRVKSKEPKASWAD
jgi:hypothetical protein